MTKEQRDLELRHSQVKKRLLELAVAEPTDETSAELATLNTEAQSIETRMQAFLLAADTKIIETETREGVEWGGLITRAAADGGIGHILNAAMGRAMTSGATLELQQALGMGAAFIPLELLQGPVETRAAATIGTAQEGNQQMALGTVFAASISDYLGIDRPVVPVGTSIYPVLTTGATTGTPAQGSATAESTGAFTTYDLKPRAIDASFRYQREDAAIFPQLSESLRAELEGALANALDDFNLNNTTAANQGITAALPDPTNPSATGTFADYVALVWGNVDGKHAVAEGDIRVLMPSAAYTHAATLYQTNGDFNAIQAMRAAGAGVRMTPHIADHASDQTIIVRKGMLPDFVSPIWNGVEIVVDELTAAGNREIILTAYMLVQHHMLRTAGFARVEIQST